MPYIYRNVPDVLSGCQDKTFLKRRFAMSDRLVTVATFHEPVAAALAKNYLESEGIPAILFDEDTIATDWMLSGAIGGIKLQVAPIHLERAEMLLAQIQAEREDADDEPIPQTAIATQEIAEDMKSEREDRELINQLTDKLFRSAVFGLIFCPLLFYSIYLLMEIASTEGKISLNRRWKVWVSMPLMLVQLLSMVFLAMPSWCIFGSR
jgi:Putative prokaryotic signal transducing protein